MDFLPFLLALAALTAWITWEHGHARPRRIATHSYHQGKKTRTHAQRQRRR